MYGRSYSPGMGQEMRSKRLEFAVDRSSEASVRDEVGIRSPIAGEGGDRLFDLGRGGHLVVGEAT